MGNDSVNGTWKSVNGFTILTAVEKSFPLTTVTVTAAESEFLLKDGAMAWFCVAVAW